MRRKTLREGRAMPGARPQAPDDQPMTLAEPAPPLCREGPGMKNEGLFF